MRNTIQLSLPAWCDKLLENKKLILENDQLKMEFVISLAMKNIEEKSGGPFAAAIFTGNQLISIGVNVVVPQNCSVAHAEMMAIMTAQSELGVYDLSEYKKGPCELFTTTEPCAMCLGAIPWSGLRRVVCAAQDKDASAIGFDEGPKPRDWKNELEKRNIKVVTDLLRPEALKVFEKYKALGGEIYNGRSN